MQINEIIGTCDSHFDTELSLELAPQHETFKFVSTYICVSTFILAI